MTTGQKEKRLPHFQPARYPLQIRQHIKRRTNMKSSLSPKMEIRQKKSLQTFVSLIWVLAGPVGTTIYPVTPLHPQILSGCNIMAVTMA